MDRRSFLTHSAAAISLARLQAQTPAPLRFAVIGLGTITDIFMRACTTARNAKVTALVSGHRDKALAIAQRYGIPADNIYSYEDFDRIRANREVDAVYIGLPNSMHCDFTVRAAQAGKHVLCEKPMAISSAQCRTMIAACHDARVKLMIAYRIQYEPLWKQAIAMIQAGTIGDIQSFQGSFFNQQAAGSWRLDRTLGGGGSVFDLGIYPLNAIRHITGEEPLAYTAVTSTRDTSGRFSQVEQSVEWTMKLPSGILASCSCSYGQRGPGLFTINGSAGWLELQPAFNYDGLRLTGDTTSGKIDIASTGKNPYQFTIEADYFAACVRDNTQPLSGGEEGLKDLLAIEAIYRAAGAPLTGAASANTTASQTVFEIIRMDSALDALIAPGTQVERIATGLQFTEGPMWRVDRLWFSDVVGDKVLAVTPSGSKQILIERAGGYPNPPAGSYLGPNAMVPDRDGTVILAQQGGRKLVRIDAALHLQPFLSTFEGKKFNSPNDLVFAPDGALWFTDPPYGLARGDMDAAKEIPFNAVFRYKDGHLTAPIRELTLPNGLGFSPDGRILYVCNSGPRMALWQYAVHPDGTTGPGSIVIEFPTGSGKGVPDGMKVDSRGNVWMTGPGGIRVVTPAGKVLGQIRLPETAANLAWAEDGHTLYITAQGSIYRLRTRVAGVLPRYTPTRENLHLP